MDANSVRAYGPGLEPNNCRANIPQRFKIDSTKSGKAPVAVDIRSEKGPLAQKPEVVDHGDGTYDVTYMPPPEGSTCKVRVTHGGKDIPKSPFEMKVRPTVEPKNVKVTGPGVSSKGIPASIPAEFTVDTTEAGYGDLQVQVLVCDEGDIWKQKFGTTFHLSICRAPTATLAKSKWPTMATALLRPPTRRMTWASTRSTSSTAARRCLTLPSPSRRTRLER